jgi:hypothetical protein
MKFSESEKDIICAFTFNALIWAFLAVALVATSGCAKDAIPPFVTVAEPEIPAECNPGNPVIQRVKADLEGGWASDAVATRVAEGWRVAYRDAQGARVTCWMQLHALRGAKPPSS